MSSKNLALVALLVLSGAACSESHNGVNLFSSKPTPVVTELQGVASLSPVEQGIILAYILNSQGKIDSGHPIGHGVTDNQGGFLLSIPNLPQGPVVVMMVGGTYKEEATLKSTNLKTRSMSVLLSDITRGKKNYFALGPLTEIAFQRWQYLMSITPSDVLKAHPLDVATQAMRTANAAVSSAFKLNDIVRVLPANPFQPLPQNASGQYAMVLSALSRAAADKGVDSSTLALAYAKNFVQRGVLDAQGSISVPDLTGKNINLIPPTMNTVTNYVNQMVQGASPYGTYASGSPSPSVNSNTPTPGVGGSSNPSPTLTPIPAPATPAPEPTVVIQGPSNSATTNAAYASSATQVPAISWDPATVNSGTLSYEVGIGSTPGAVDVVPILWAGTLTSMQSQSVSALTCQHCYITVSAIVPTPPHSKIIASGSWIIDTTPPERVTANLSGAVTNVGMSSFTSISMTVGGNGISSNFVDNESQIAGYQVAIGDTDGASNVVAWTDVPLFACNNTQQCATITTPTGTFAQGRNYYVSVRAKNGAGLASAVSHLATWNPPWTF